MNFSFPWNWRSMERERDRERISNVIFIFCLTSPHTYRPPTYFRFVCIDKLFRKQESHLWGKDRRIHFWKKKLFQDKEIENFNKEMAKNGILLFKNVFSNNILQTHLKTTAWFDLRSSNRRQARWPLDHPSHGPIWRFLRTLMIQAKKKQFLNLPFCYWFVLMPPALNRAQKSCQK